MVGHQSVFDCEIGGDLFVRVAGPLYLGALLDYPLTYSNGLLVAGGMRVVLADLAVSAGFGYSNVESGGIGALAAVELMIIGGLALRAQGSWRHGSQNAPFQFGVEGPVTTADYSKTVWSMMGGLSLRL